MTSGPVTGLSQPGFVLLSLAVVLVTVLVLALGTAPVLSRLPEPGPDHPGFDPDKTPYRALARPPFVAGCAVAGGVAATVVVLSTTPASWPPWLVLATAAVLLAGVDAATTWLPWRLTWTTGAALLAAGGLALLLGATPTALLRLVLGAVIAFGWYLLVYLLSRRRLGVGDVWLAPLVGAPAAMTGWGTLYWALLLGAVAGGVQGLVLLVRGRRGGFAYAPAIVAGGFLALALRPLLDLFR